MALSIQYKEIGQSFWMDELSIGLTGTGGTYYFDVRFYGYTYETPSRQYGFSGFSNDFGWSMATSGTPSTGSDYIIQRYALTFTPNPSAPRTNYATFYAKQSGQANVTSDAQFGQNPYSASIDLFNDAEHTQSTTGTTITYNDTSDKYLYVTYTNMSASTSGFSITKSANWITNAQWYPVSTSRSSIYLKCSQNNTFLDRTGVVTVKGKDISNRNISTTYTIKQTAAPHGNISLTGGYDYVPWHDDEPIYSVYCSYEDMSLDTITYSTNVSWLHPEWEDEGDKETLNVYIDNNEGNTNRTGTVTVSGSDIYGHTITKTVSYTQLFNPTYPIWKDVYYTGSTSTLDYYITMDEDSNAIYTGRAYIQPNHTNVKINISKICKDYLSNRITDGNSILGLIGNERLYNHNAIHVFHLYKVGVADELAYYIFYYNWSYKELTGQQQYGDYIEIDLTTPINGHLTSGMKPLYTTSNYRDDYTEYNYYETYLRATKYTSGYCGEYAIYYLQRNGGWAAFLIEGGVKKTDSYEKYSYDMSFDNTKAEFEQATYHNQIVTDWVVTTNWLTDTQSENLAFNLIPSNQVFLHDLKANKIIPVVITDTSADYKTFKNNGRKMVNYTIRMKESQKKQLM